MDWKCLILFFVENDSKQIHVTIYLLFHLITITDSKSMTMISNNLFVTITRRTCRSETQGRAGERPWLEEFNHPRGNGTSDNRQDENSYRRRRRHLSRHAARPQFWRWGVYRGLPRTNVKYVSEQIAIGTKLSQRLAGWNRNQVFRTGPEIEFMWIVFSKNENLK